MEYHRMRQQPAYASPAQISGLARFFTQTYAWMTGGLAIMALTAYFTANTPAVARVLFGSNMASLLLMLVWFGATTAIQARIPRADAGTAANLFLAYSVLTGVSLASLFLHYSGGSLARTFAVTAGAFGGAACYGAITKRDMGPVASFMLVGLVGFMVATVLNIFLHSEAIYWVSTYAFVLIYAGLTAYQNQALRRQYFASGEAHNAAIAGALVLSLSFINLFLALLRFQADDRR